ncbi:hypothetical protein N9T05_00370 [bacterium]|jgi:hypothetical protein|nr:hypothetical protein [bacterium]|tara:strand:+ start:59 stop:283 length:225 start_codon:yes stop_codon:yes gene_type:complete
MTLSNQKYKEAKEINNILITYIEKIISNAETKYDWLCGECRKKITSCCSECNKKISDTAKTGLCRDCFVDVFEL